MKYVYFFIACAAISLSACEGKKSLDGYPMDKPPPSAFIERDSAPDELQRSDEVDKGSDSSESEEKN